MSLQLEAVVEQRGVDVGFVVPDGETLALLGPNGSGKSTALAVAAGLVRTERGRVVLDGRILSDPREGVHVPPHDRRTALLGQDPLLFPHLTALDNVAFGVRVAGVSRRDARARAAEWLDEVGVGELAGRRPAELSGGQAQRVAVARALAAEPQVLLLDEPLAALDVDVAPTMRQVLRKVLVGRTAVVVTHDVLDALLLADHVVVLDSGSIVEEGPTGEVLSRPRTPFAARLAGLNLVVGTWTGDGVRRDDGVLFHGLVGEAALTEGGDAVAAFRPQTVAVYREPVGGSPRNSFMVTITALEPLGDLVRVRAGSLSADVTTQSLAALELLVGQRVTFTVKATEVAVYPL